jgi:hypothetical protein
VRLQPLGHLSRSAKRAQYSGGLWRDNPRRTGAQRRLGFLTTEAVRGPKAREHISLAVVVISFVSRQHQEDAMGRGLLLWLLGIPLPIILLIWLLGGLHS